ncbi:MAG: electron transfer flavoprotein subunit beta/FixA family protein [Anaerolineae bacterium]|nr:electron transfer flavoprotein subunit beta/FixA family protein [Anaerolineae bacterium]
MSIVVVTKSVPDTAARVEVNAQGAVTWGDAPLVVNPWDEYSVTEAILLKEKHNVKTTALAVGEPSNDDALKWSLSLGIDEVARVWDDGMKGQDSLGYASAVAAAIRKIGDVKLAIFGKELIDVGTDAHVFMTARKLGWTALGFVFKIRAIDFAAGTITVERLVEEGKQIVTAKLPAVISVVKDINEPRSPSFIGIRKASKAAIPVWSSSDLGISAAPAKAQTTAYQNLAARTGSVEVIEGANELEKAEKLAQKLLEEKVI